MLKLILNRGFDFYQRLNSLKLFSEEELCKFVAEMNVSCLRTPLGYQFIPRNPNLILIKSVGEKEHFVFRFVGDVELSLLERSGTVFYKLYRMTSFTTTSGYPPTPLEDVFYGLSAVVGFGYLVNKENIRPTTKLLERNPAYITQFHEFLRDKVMDLPELAQDLSGRAPGVVIPGEGEYEIDKDLVQKFQDKNFVLKFL